MTALLLYDLLGEEDGVDVGQHTAGSDGHLAEELVQFLVVAHSQLDVAGDDAGLLVVAGGVTSQLEHLSGQVLKHSGQVHGGAGAHALGVLAGLQEATHTSHGELEPSLGGPGGGLLAVTSPSLSFSGHDYVG